MDMKKVGYEVLSFAGMLLLGAMMYVGWLGIGDLFRPGSTTCLVQQAAPQQAQPLTNRFTIAPQVAKVRPAVVHVAKLGVCQGSGVILTPDGIIASAKHVSDNEPGEYTVTLDDGREFAVKYVVEDRDHDVSFMQLDLRGAEPNLPVAALADLDTIRVGDFLFIMGSPFGKANFNSVSLGILSAMQRDVDAEMPGGFGYGWAVTFQSDATAEPGNSGGPVFNLDGEVIGILVAGMDATVNYSVPVNVFMGDMDTIRQRLAMCRFEPVEDAPAPVYDGYGYLHSGTAVKGELE